MNTQPIRVLLVEDNELNRDMLSRRLTRAGFNVLTAIDGEEALILMRKVRPDVVLLDMNLPIKDGWTTAKEARLDPALQNLPIIALTAHAMESDRLQAIEAGCNDYATKPIDFPDLLQKIEEAVL
jgi:two-component system cell cycle response regulator DivK